MNKFTDIELFSMLGMSILIGSFVTIALGILLPFPRYDWKYVIVLLVFIILFFIIFTISLSKEGEQ